MYYIGNIACVPSDEIRHHGIMGMKWGVRRFQDKNGNYTAAGKARYGITDRVDKAEKTLYKKVEKAEKTFYKKADKAEKTFYKKADKAEKKLYDVAEKGARAARKLEKLMASATVVAAAAYSAYAIRKGFFDAARQNYRQKQDMKLHGDWQKLKNNNQNLFNRSIDASTASYVRRANTQAFNNWSRKHGY